MKRLAFASIFLSLGAYAACSAEEPSTGTNTGGGGPVNGGASGTTGQGGVAGTAGTPALGGTSGTGVGGASGTAGTPAVGGTSPVGGTGGDTGGALPTGGSGGDGTMTGGSGGDGMTGGAGGMTGGNGGAGGMTGGNGGAAGMGMGGKAMGGSGGGTCTATIDGLFNTDRRFDGRLTETPCAVSNSNDCTGGGWRVNGGNLTGCSGGKLDADQTIMVGGTPGQNYTVTLHFYGITEPKAYGGNVTRQSGNTRPTNNQDTTCSGNGNDRVCGANPPPFAYRTGVAGGCNPPGCFDDSDYNSYEIHVKDQAGMDKCSYFLNSDTTQGHWTYSLDYARTINVIGGGSIRIRSYDRNCRMIKNCADNSSATDCTPYARTVNVSAAMPAPANLQQPGLGLTGKDAGQWLLIDVLAVSCATAAPASCAPLPNP
jgi:hypothetical protein